MGEKELKELARLICIAHKATGKAYILALLAIGQTIMRQAETEPLVIHNTDSWRDERIEV